MTAASRARAALALLFAHAAASSLLACGDEDPGRRPAPDAAVDAGDGDGGLDGSDDGSLDGGAGDADGGASETRYLGRLESPDDYAEVAGPGAEVKYLARVDGKTPPVPLDVHECAFQNTREFEYHLFFLRTFPEHASLTPQGYTDLVLRRASRSLWGGGLKQFAATPHPRTGKAGVLSYTVYSNAGEAEALSVAELTQIDGRLKGCMPYAADLLVLVPDGADQLAHFRTIAGELEAAGVSLVEPSALVPGLGAEVYAEGEAYGYLGVVPLGEVAEASAPRDVVVTEAAPNDLALVAGLVTKLPQSLASHVNLRLREKGIPSASVPGIYDNELVMGLADRLVHLVVEGDSVTIEPARLEDAEAFWDAHRPSVGQPASDLAVKTLVPLTDATHTDAIAYGAKAANLGELHGVLPAQNRMEGFAIPFSAYAEFAEARGITAEVEALVADPRVRTDAAYKRDRLKALRDRIRAAELLPGFVNELDAAVRAAFGDAGPTTRLRFRSSTNAEDLPGLTGAGLYDSRSGCLADDLDADTTGPSACLTEEQKTYLESELARRRAELAAHPERTFLVDIVADLEDDLGAEKSAHLAVRRVWASLWNERAFDDREYYGIDHRQVYMGIAVHPTLVGEQLESVVVTNLEPSAEQPLYRLVSQAGEIGVVRPVDPSATPEVLTFRRSATGTAAAITLVAASSLAPAGTKLWSDAALAELAPLLFAVQDHFATAVYPEISPLQLDIEIDISMDGRILLKQARPYIEAGL